MAGGLAFSEDIFSPEARYKQQAAMEEMRKIPLKQSIANYVKGLYASGVPQEQILEKAAPMIAEYDPIQGINLSQQVAQQKEQRFQQKLALWQMQGQQILSNPSSTQEQIDTWSAQGNADPEISRVLPQGGLKITKTDTGHASDFQYSQLSPEAKSYLAKQYPGFKARPNDLVKVTMSNGKITDMTYSPVADMGGAGGGTGSQLSPAQKQGYIKQFQLETKGYDINAGVRSIGGMIQIQNNAMIKAIDMLEKGVDEKGKRITTTKQIFNDVQNDVISALTGRVNVPEGQRKELYANTAYADFMNKMQYLLGKPIDIKSPEMKQQLVMQMMSLNDSNKLSTELNLDTTEQRLSPAMREMPELQGDYDKLKSTVTGKFDKINERAQKVLDKLGKKTTTQPAQKPETQHKEGDTWSDATYNYRIKNGQIQRKRK